MSRRFSVILSMALMVLSLSVVILGSAAFAVEQLSIAGSTTVLPIAQRAAEVFMKENPDVRISVSGGGSGNGIAALIDKSIDIADASRFIKPSETEKAVKNGVHPVPHRIAMDGIAIIVHPSNSISKITIDQLSKIYTGEIDNWKQLGGPDERIVVISRDSSSGTYEVFEDKVLKGARVSPRALLQASNQTVATAVSNTRGAIGYVGLGYISSKVKALDVSADGKTYVKASLATVANGKYPISRPLYMFTNGWPAGAAMDFINFILSKRGQKIVLEEGFVPLQPEGGRQL